MFNRSINKHDSPSILLDARSNGPGIRTGVYRQFEDDSKGSSLFGRNELSASKQSPLLLLGRTSNTPKMVLWESTRIGNRSSVGLFIESFGDGTIKPTGPAGMLSRLSADTRYKLSCLNATRCINYINYIFNSGEVIIFLPTEETTNLVDLLSVAPQYANVPASHVGPLHFVAGPPNQRELKQGSLLTLLQDLILLSICGSKNKLIQQLEEAVNRN